MAGARFLIVVPYAARDLEGHALVARQLEDQFGHHVSVTNGYSLEMKLRRTPADVLVLDHLAWDFKIREARLAKSLGMRVAVLPTEGLVLNGTAVQELAGSRHGPLDAFDIYLCWGTFHQGALLPLVDDKRRLPVVGCPRFDFYQPPLRCTLPSKRVLSVRVGFRNVDAPLIVWATNTPYAQMPKHKVLGRYKSKAGWDQDEIAALYKDQCEQFAQHATLMKDVALDMPDINIIVKVHPAERPKPYVEFFGGIPNVSVEFGEPFRQYALACDVLIHRSCTTATEAWILGKRVIELEIGQYENPPVREVTIGCEVADSPERLRSLLEAAVEDPEPPRDLLGARRDFLERFYGGVGSTSADRVASALDGLVGDLDPSEQERVDHLRSEEWARFLREEGDTVAYRAKRFLRLDPATSLRPWRALERQLRRWREGHVAEPPVDRAMLERAWREIDEALARAGCIGSEHEP